MTKQFKLYNEDNTRAEASSMTINITLRDIFDILERKTVYLRDRPLRDTLTFALLMLYYGRINLPSPMCHAVITPASLEPHFDDQHSIDPYQLTNRELRDFLDYLKALQIAKIETLPILECMLYVKSIEGIFKERLERKQAKRPSRERHCSTLHTQSDIEYAKIIYQEMLSKLPNKRLKMFDLVDVSLEE